MDGKLKPIHAGMTILEGMMMKSDKVELRCLLFFPGSKGQSFLIS
jgi:hypothetical protein